MIGLYATEERCFDNTSNQELIELLYYDLTRTKKTRVWLWNSRISSYDLSINWYGLDRSPQIIHGLTLLFQVNL